MCSPPPKGRSSTVQAVVAGVAQSWLAVGEAGRAAAGDDSVVEDAGEEAGEDGDDVELHGLAKNDLTWKAANTLGELQKVNKTKLRSKQTSSPRRQSAYVCTFHSGIQFVFAPNLHPGKTQVRNL